MKQNFSTLKKAYLLFSLIIEHLKVRCTLQTTTSSTIVFIDIVDRITDSLIICTLDYQHYMYTCIYLPVLLAREIFT